MQAKLVLMLSVLAACALAPSSAIAATDLQPNPTSYDFGNQDIHNTSPSSNIDFQNNGGGLLTVTSVGFGGSDPSDFVVSNDGCTGANLNPGDICTVSVSFAPAAVGSKSATLDLGDDVPEIAFVPLTGDGQTGSLTPGSNPLTFGPQPYYYGPQYNSVNIFNNGSYAVHVTSTSLSGPNAGLFSISSDGCTAQTLNPGNSCNVGMYFNPTAAINANATLTINSDASDDPVDIALNGIALAGGHAVISPLSHDFGVIAVGHSAGKAFTVSNTGDAPFSISQILVVSGTPQYFPVLSDSCSGAQINPSSSCQFTVAIQPGGIGFKEASLFMIAGNLPQPVTTIGVFGEGQAVLGGSAVVAGTPQVGSALTCQASGFPDRTDYQYDWSANGNAIAGQTSHSYAPSNEVLHKRIACQVTASNSVSTTVVTSPATAPVEARSLTGLAGAFSGSNVCRSVQAPTSVMVGKTKITIDRTSPVTPQAPLAFVASNNSKLSLSVSGKKIVKGTGRVSLTPRQLGLYPDGTLTVAVAAGKSSKNKELVLAGCGLAVSLFGGPGQTAQLGVSAQHAISSLSITLPHALRLKAARRVLGQITVRAYGSPAQNFDLFGPKTTSNGINVSLSKRKVHVSGLPSDTGVVTLSLRSGTIRGHAGTVTATSKGALSSADPTQSARGPAIWRR